jgi:sugar/nucleoside kinase (ribokinase family)
MRIAVAGAICYDENIAASGDRHTSFGGVLYNVAALSGLLRPHESVVPVSNVGDDRFDEIAELIAPWPGVDLTGVVRVTSPTTHVTLTWKDLSEREEVVRHLMPPLDLDTLLRAARMADALHINFTTGGDVSLGTLRDFRRVFHGCLSMDVHQLVAHFDDKGHRFVSGFYDWPDWARYVDVLQCNEQELAAMFRGPLPDDRALERAAADICAAGPRAVCVTLAGRGAVMVHRRDGRFYRVRLEAPAILPVKDTTGCGDSFSAGFLVGLLEHEDAVSAMALGLLTAAVNAVQHGVAPLKPVAPYRVAPRLHLPGLAGRDPDWQGVLLTP